MSLPLKVAFLWHQHQPYYKKQNEFILPWVRLHAAKDYYDLPVIATEFPSLKQTFNLVPSLLMQLADYCSGNARDNVQRLSLISAEVLTMLEKQEILRLFFLCNAENMIAPFERYRDLWTQSHNPIKAIAEFTVQDWRDLQAWYNLTWIGQSERCNEKILKLFEKGKNFNNEDIALILDTHKDIMSNVLPLMQRMQQNGQAEISISPLYHPIVPLLINSQAALESMECNLPSPPFSRPDDARMQIERSINFCNKVFGKKPNGMWFSEGSISDATLEMAIEAGIQWTASDEDVLWASLSPQRHWTEKYFPRKVTSENGSINLLFRDHELSDAIGFVYSRWQADQAALDFCNRLHHIRQSIIEQYGEVALHHAVVPVILDGENCWEYYYRNGEQFLKELYARLSESTDLTTVLCSEAASDEHASFLQEISHIRAGSWINANFKIWIGHADDNAAWSLLRDVREKVDEQLQYLNTETSAKALEHCYIAEGSDWFWWYGDEHLSENQQDFDELFRWNIAEVYNIMGITPPEEVFKPIGIQKRDSVTPPLSKITPLLTGEIKSETWDNSGVYEPSHTTGAMHAANVLLRRIRYCNDDNFLYFRFELTRPIKKAEEIIVYCHKPMQYSFSIGMGKTHLHIDPTDQRIEFAAIIDGVAEASIAYINNLTDLMPEFNFVVCVENEIVTYPRNGSVKLRLL